MYRKTLTAAAAVLASLAVAGPATAATGSYTHFSSPTAFNGAHLYSRTHMDVASSDKVTVDCLKRKPGSNDFAVRWTCTVDVYQGVSTLKAHATIDVLRRDGRYVFRASEVAAAR